MIVRFTFLALFVCLIFPPYLFSQAWTPPQGEGYASVTFEDMFVKDHFLSSGARIDIGHIRTVSLVESIQYGITDQLGASLSLPVMASKYWGPDPHQMPIDDGNYHGGTQDFRIGLQYNVRQRRRPAALTPFVTVIIPSRDYIYYAHSAVGTHQPELDLGLAAGGRLERWLPNAYYQAAYSFGIVGVVTGVRPNRNHMSLEGGYLVGRHLTLRALADSQITEGGFNIPQDFPQRNDWPLVADDRWRHHDQSANINILNMGGGLDVAVGRSAHDLHHPLTLNDGSNSPKLASSHSAYAAHLGPDEPPFVLIAWCARLTISHEQRSAICRAERQPLSRPGADWSGRHGRGLSRP